MRCPKPSQTRDIYMGMLQQPDAPSCLRVLRLRGLWRSPPSVFGLSSEALLEFDAELQLAFDRSTYAGLERMTTSMSKDTGCCCRLRYVASVLIVVALRSVRGSGHDQRHCSSARIAQ